MAKFSLKILRSLPAREKKITISTAITLARLFLIPFIVVAMIFDYWLTAFIFFCIAAISDILDGFVARWLNEHTFLGACLDPMVDKLLVFAVFATLAFLPTPLLHIPRWFVMIVFIKELIIIIGSLLLYSIKGHLIVKPTRLGKTTALLQMLFIIWLFACYFFHWLPLKTFYLLLAIVIFFLFSSLLQYIRIGMKQWKFL